MYDYNTIIDRNKDRFVKVQIDAKKKKKIEDFIPVIIAAKQAENEHRFDCFNEEKRWRTGLYGEAALENLFGISIIDWTVGPSQQYGVPDVKGYKVGIKTVEAGAFPIIKKRNSYSQIICIKDGEDVLVCGIAEPDVLNNYQSEDLILSSRLKAKGYKTGFYGFDYLMDCKTIKDIERFKI